MKKILLTLAAVILTIPYFCAAEEKKSGDFVTLTDVPSTLVYPSFWHTPFGVHRGTPFWLKVFLGNKTYFSDRRTLRAQKCGCRRDKPGRDDCARRSGLIQGAGR